jgi:hypothetical protein
VKRCHHCEKEVPDGFYIAMCARHTSQKVYDVELAFHMDCFMEVAGEDYAQDLAHEIHEWVINAKKVKKSALNANRRAYR